MRKFLLICYHILDKPLFVLLTVSFISSFISTKTFWLAPAVAMTFPIFVIMYLAITFISYIKKRRWIVKLFIILSFSIIHFYNHISLMQDSSDKTDFKVMGFNARLFDIYNWIDREAWADWAPRQDDGRILRDIYNMIKNNDADVFCVQEFYFQPNSDYSTTDTLQEMGYKFQHVEYLYRDVAHGINHNYGIATFSKHPIIHQEVIKKDNLFKNGALITDVLINEDTVRFVNVHFESFRFDKDNYQMVRSFYNKNFKEIEFKEIAHLTFALKRGFQNRTREIEIIDSIINNSSFPCVLSCDLNESPSSNGYKKLSKNLNDAFLDSGFGISSTTTINFPLRIDYLLFSRELKSYNYRTDKEKELSDHYPVICDFVLEP